MRKALSPLVTRALNLLAVAVVPVALLAATSVVAQEADEEIPPDLIGFTVTDNCPEDGWTEAFDLRGRIPIGLPEGVDNGATHGDPLESGEDRVHGHALQTTVNVPSIDVALISGCCFDQTGGNGTFDVVGTAEPVSSGMPTIALRACRKR